MKQFFGIVTFALLVFLVLFGKRTLIAILPPATKPAVKGVVWPLDKPVVTTQRVTTTQRAVQVATTKSTTILDSLLIPADAKSTEAEDNSLFESLKLKPSAALEVPDYTPERERDVPANLKLVRAQPSVYKILEYGDLEMKIPAKVQVDDDALMRAFAADGGVPAGPDRTNDPKLTQYLWAKLAEAPQQYLTFDGEQAATRFENELMASGTGFLVSRDGIVLTNAHVIGDMADQPLTNDPIVLASLIGPSCDAFMKSTIELFGGEPAPELRPQVATSVLQWFAANGRMTGTFRRAELVLQFKKKGLDNEDVLKLDLDEFFKRPPVPIVAPLEVLFKGEELPGKDVAILRVSAGDFDPIDRAICLPLGDSEEVLAGARVQALGFPGIAFNEHIMDQTAAYRVSAQDGQVANTKRMTGGYDAIEMTADINHGDSGGPVVDVDDGLVIGLNVGAASEQSHGHTLAIPVNVAKEMLADLKIDLDPGPATALWIDALRQYDAKQYAEATQTLSRLVKLQAKWTELDGTMIKDLSADWVPEWDAAANPYVVDLLKRARAKAK
jgi:S1-C subfamily serine protease